MSADNSKCAVLVPIASVLEPETDEALRALAGRGYHVRTLRGSSQVDLARATLATRALRDGYQETMWIDSDTSFHPDDVDRLRSYGQSFVAGLYPCKGPKRMAGKLLPDAGKVMLGEGGSIIEMEYVGMGFTLVYRSVYESVARDLYECSGGYDGEKVVPYFLPMLKYMDDETPSCYLSEDYSFCARARNAGYSIMADTALKLGHVGKKVYTWDDIVSETQLPSLPVEMLASGEIVAKVMSLGQHGEVINHLMQVLKRVQTGEYDPSRLHVDLEQGTVTVDALEESAV
jgi:hypothetical protein